MSAKRKGIVYTFASAAFLSVTFIASKQALLELESLQFTPVWFAMASIWGIGYYIIQPNKVTLTSLQSHWKGLVLIGISSSAANLFFFTAVQKGDPTVVSFFSRSQTIFTLIWGVLLLGEHLSRRQWLGATVAILGAGLMTWQGGSLIWMVLGLAVTANFFNSITSYIAKRNVSGVPPIILGIARTVGLTIILGCISFFSGMLVVPSMRAMMWIIGGSFFGPFLSFVLFYKGLETMDMGQAAIIRATQPLFVAVYSLILFGSTISLLQFAGGLVILAGVVLMLSFGSHKQIASMSNPLLFFRRQYNRLNNRQPSQKYNQEP